MAWRGMARQGKARAGVPSGEGLRVLSGGSPPLRPGLAWRGAARHGGAGRGKARRGVARQGLASPAVRACGSSPVDHHHRGSARLGSARHGWAGLCLAGLGLARHGVARHGAAGQGKGWRPQRGGPAGPPRWITAIAAERGRAWQGAAGLGAAGRGRARRGKARQGKGPYGQPLITFTTREHNERHRSANSIH